MNINLNGISNPNRLRNLQNNNFTAENSDKTFTEKTKNSRLIQAEEFLMKQDILSSQQNAEAAGETTKDMYTALEIYRRMSRGDIVSEADEKYLMEFDAELYMLAKYAQLTAKEHEDRSDDSLSEESDENRSSAQEGSISEFVQAIQNIDSASSEPSVTANSNCE